MNLSPEWPRHCRGGRTESAYTSERRHPPAIFVRGSMPRLGEGDKEEEKEESWQVKRRRVKKRVEAREMGGRRFAT